jgi:bacterioferritin-associated ferredoxin
MERREVLLHLLITVIIIVSSAREPCWTIKEYRPMYLCLCKGITDSDVREAGQEGLVMPCQLKAKFGLKEPGCCGRCSKNIHEFVEIAMSTHQAPFPGSVRS